jgi:membrane associated rhomboid family serine protease
MIPAAVGFQCPECVVEGTRATRQNQGPYGGERSGNPALTSIVLIVINAAVWLLITLTGGGSSPWLYRLGLLPDGVCLLGDGRLVPNAEAGACAVFGNATEFVPGVADGAWWQLLTSAFTHVDLMHIGFNMLALWFLGPQLERVIGRTRFLALYLLSALAGSAAVLWLSADYSLTFGASGAVFGLMGALLVLALKVRGNVQGVLIWLGLNVAYTFLGTGISWQGHLGGLVGGAVIAAILAYAPRENRGRVQALGLAGFGVLLCVLIAVRVLQLA